MERNSFRDALRECIDRPSLGSILRLQAESPPGSLRSLVVLCRIASREDLDDRTLSFALTALAEVMGPEGLKHLLAVRKPTRERTARLRRAVAGVPGGASAMAQIVRHRDANEETRWEALVSLVELEGPAGLRRVLQSMVVKHFNSSVAMLKRLLREAETLLDNPAPVIAELVCILSDKRPDFLERASGKGKTRKLKASRRLSKLRKRWQSLVIRTDHLRPLMGYLGKLADLGSWDVIEWMIVVAPGRMTGLAAAEIIRARRPDKFALLLRAFARSEQIWIAQRYADLLAGLVGSKAYAEVLLGSGTAEAKVVAADIVAREGGKTLDKKSIEVLMHAAKHDRSLTVRRAALTGLSAFDTPEVVEFLVRAASARGEGRSFRKVAKQSLQRLGKSLLSAVLPDAEAQKAAKAIAEAASGSRRLRGAKARDMSEAAEILRLCLSAETETSPALDAAFRVLDEQGGKAAAAHRIGAGIHEIARQGNPDIRAAIARELELELVVVTRKSSDARFQAEKERAAKRVLTSLAEAVCRRRGMTDMTSPQSRLLSQVVLRSLTQTQDRAFALQRERAREKIRRWRKLCFYSVST